MRTRRRKNAQLIKTRKKVGKFLQRRRKDLGLNQDQVAKILNYKDKQAISNIERGVAPLPFNRIKKLANLLKLERKRLAKLACLDKDPDLFKDIEFVYIKPPEDEEQITDESKFMIPVITPAMCAKWKDFSNLSFPREVAEQYELGESNDPNAFYALMEGETEAEKIIQPGDLLLIEPNHPTGNKDLVLLVTSRGFKVRKLVKTPHGDALQPLDSDYDATCYEESKNNALFFIRALKRKVNKERLD